MGAPAGAFQIALGVLISIIPGGAVHGIPLIIGGVATIAASLILPDVSEATDEAQSPVYGYRPFSNPSKAGAVHPVIYSVNGVRTAPIWTQAWITPIGHSDEEAAKTQSRKGQRMSGVLTVCEGPIVRMDNLQFNDDHVWDVFTEHDLGTGNGSNKTFRINASRVDMESVRVYVGALQDTLKGWIVEEVIEPVATGNGSRSVYSFESSQGVFDATKTFKFYSENPTNRPDAELYALSTAVSSLTEMVPTMQLMSPTRMVINTQIPLAFGKVLWVKFWRRRLEGIQIVRADDGDTKIIFDSAPASLAVLTVDFRRSMFAGLSVEERMGTPFDAPLRGAHDIKNSYRIEEETRFGVATTYQMRDAADNVIFVWASGANGMNRLNLLKGGRSGSYAQLTIEARLIVSSGTSIWNTWQRIPDPRGKLKRHGHKKLADEFELMGDSLSEIFWGLNIRELLEKYHDKHPNNAGGRKRLNDFVRGRYEFRVQRSSRKGVTDSKTAFTDTIILSQAKEVIDEFLSQPGRAKIKFENLRSRRVGGRVPGVKVDVVGIANCVRWDDTLDVPDWVEDEASQGNRVWAMVNFITNKNYGGGDHSTLADIDTASAKVVADILDENVRISEDDEGGEVRCQLDAVLDTRRVLLDWMKRLAIPGRVFVYQQGNTWKFVYDGDVDLLDADGVDLVPVIYDSTIAGRTKKKSAKLGRPETHTIPTSLEIDYLRRDDDFRQKQVRVQLQDSHTEVVRHARADGFGITRQTELVRYANWKFARLRASGMNLAIGVSPQAMRLEAGDVFRFISARIGIDGWWRVFETVFGSDTFYVQIDGRQYDPESAAEDFKSYRVIEVGARDQQYSRARIRPQATPVVPPRAPTTCTTPNLPRKRTQPFDRTRGGYGRQRRVNVRARRKG